MSLLNSKINSIAGEVGDLSTQLVKIQTGTSSVYTKAQIDTAITIPGTLNLSIVNLGGKDLATKLSNVASNKVAIANNANIAQYVRLCHLNLPSGGNHANIHANLANGYAVGANDATVNNTSWVTSNYALDIYIYSSNGTTRIFDTGSYPTGTTVRGCNFSGFATATCPSLNPTGGGTNPLGVYLVPTQSDYLNQVDVWVGAYLYYGNPIVTVSMAIGGGSYDATPLCSQTLPNTGWINLETYKINMTRFLTPSGRNAANGV